MKKLIFISLALLALLTISCTEEGSTSVSQPTSVWRSTNFTDTTLASAFEYYEFRFTSASTLELWVKSTTNATPERVNQVYNYIIKDNSISIVYNDVTTNGSIDKTSMSISENGNSMKFEKI
jgi:hypothetical protein